MAICNEMGPLLPPNDNHFWEETNSRHKAASVGRDGAGFVVISDMGVTCVLYWSRMPPITGRS